MKQRNGFVSNSSSSSFIIGSKTSLTTQKIVNLFETPMKSPFFSIVKEISKTIHECLGKPYATLDDLKKDFDEDNMIAFAKKLFDEGFIVYFGSFSSEGEGAEKMLCDLSINFNGKDFRIKHDGGET